MTSLLHDLRFAARSFARAPRFTLPALLALALGIGATSATFSIVRGVMLKPLPYHQPERIVVVWENNQQRNRPRNVISAANWLEWRARNRSFTELGIAGPARLTLTVEGRPEEIAGLVASSHLFPVLGVRPALGRGYTEAEDIDGSDQVLVITHEFWQARLGGRADVLGSTITADGQPRVVIGVMAPGFSLMGQTASFLMPYGWTLEQLRSAPGRGSSFGLARLRDGVTFAQASDDMRTIAAALGQEVPGRNAGWSVTLVPIHEQMIDQIRPALQVLSGAVALVLLIACVNVANLLLARSTVREQEIGLRAALGAKRSRLVRQMLSESVLLSLMGAAGGLVVALAFHRGLLALVADRIPIPRLEQVALDLPVLGFTLAVAFGSALLFGVVPALLASRSPNEALRDGGRHGGSVRSRRTLGTLVVVEIAVALVLLAGAGLLIRSFVRLQAVDPGFRAEGLITARVQVPSSRYKDPRQSSGFYTEVLSRIGQIPGVTDQAAVSFLPFTGLGIGTSYWRADRPEPAAGDAATTAVRPVTPNWFRTMGIPQLAGRDVTAGDAVDAPAVAVISESLARRDYPGENPLGQRLHVQIGRPEGNDYEIVGVVGDIRMTSLESATGPAVYIPHTQLAIGLMTFVVRTGLDPHSLVPGIAAAVRGLDAELPLADVRTMEEVIDQTLARPRVIAVLLAVFAVMALALAGVGVYGVMAFSVAERTHEIGVRMALGATPQSVLRLVIAQAFRLVFVGVAAGLLAAIALTRVLSALLFDTDARDPWTLAGTALVLMLVALAAASLPARRGTRIMPIQALRVQ
ncbi:MAG TPA: ABC transporter permease [Patescibacteria group bacterium]|nr:ABC transporter permease [Patescibacteria group bacterium]